MHANILPTFGSCSSYMYLHLLSFSPGGRPESAALVLLVLLDRRTSVPRIRRPRARHRSTKTKLQKTTKLLTEAGGSRCALHREKEERCAYHH